MSKIPNLFLVGSMAAGKTSIGRMLAHELGLKFYDSDKFIEERSGASIPWIFDIEGEAGYRKREQRAIAELTQKLDIVLATGGGAILAAENRMILAARGHVIYLKVGIDKQLQRTEKCQNRPLLQTEDPRARLEALNQTRGPLYAEIADYTIDTNTGSIRTIVAKIIKHVRETYC